MEELKMTKEFLEDMATFFGYSREDVVELYKQRGDITITKELAECHKCKKPFMVFRGLLEKNQPCPYCNEDFLLED